jgi:ferric-dicitrate binding protein FerR (iron transport regulator)
MATASIEVSGPDAERLAGELRAALEKAAGPGEGASPVEVQRSAELVVAVIGLVFSGVGAAKTLWDWWQATRSQPTSVTGAGAVRVRVLLTDGTVVDLSSVDSRQLELELGRRLGPRSNSGG